MLKGLFRRRKPSEVFRVGGVIFLREQDGVPEQDIKADLARLFEKRTDVNSAYLAAVSYEGRSDHNVALCITGVADADQPELAKAVSAIFALNFARDQHLDIMFPSESRIEQLKRTCRPFFVRDAGDARQ